MKNVRDGEIVAEGGDDRGPRGEEDGCEYGDAGAAGGSADAVPATVFLKYQGEDSRSERIGAQNQRDEQSETTDLGHGGKPRIIFSETTGSGNNRRAKRL